MEEGSGARMRRFNWGVLPIAVGALAAVAMLVLTPRAATEEASCTHGEHKTIEVGIVKAIGCWTQTTTGGQTVDTAAWEDQKEGIDLNGFVLTGPKGGGLQINESTRRVTSIS